jgi:hypothetical protein
MQVVDDAHRNRGTPMNRLGLLLGMMLAVGCTNETCFYTPTHVVLQPTTPDGGNSQAMGLLAISNGRSCGCCGGKAPTIIISYAWDLDGDGIVDRTGATLSEVDIPIPSAPLHVSVTVTDSEGTTATADVTIPGP